MAAAADRAYYRDSYLPELSTSVTSSGIDSSGTFVNLAATLFHPQGGGQPADKGVIVLPSGRFAVRQLEEDKVTGEIKHYLDPAPDGVLAVGVGAHLQLDMASRLTFARLHTAGHLVANVVEQLYPGITALKGNHFPGQAFVVFKGGPYPDKDELKQRLNQELSRIAQESRPVTTTFNDSGRTVGIGGFAPCPCGGTHVANTAELAGVTVRCVRIQKGELKVGYDM